MIQTVGALSDGAVLQPEKALILERDTRVQVTVEFCRP